MGFLINNLGTIIVAAALLALVILIVAGIIRKKRRGQCLSCDCASCPKAGECRPK